MNEQNSDVNIFINNACLDKLSSKLKRFLDVMKYANVAFATGSNQAAPFANASQCSKVRAVEVVHSTDGDVPKRPRHDRVPPHFAMLRVG